MDASMLTNKTDDITRASVQKSVCVLSRLPLYGHIQVKMSLITEAYFREVRKTYRFRPKKAWFRQLDSSMDMNVVVTASSVLVLRKFTTAF